MCSLCPLREASKGIKGMVRELNSKEPNCITNCSFINKISRNLATVQLSTPPSTSSTYPFSVYPIFANLANYFLNSINVLHIKAK
jgi:hypothetical protein